MNFKKEINSYEDLCKILGIDPELKPDVSAYDDEDKAAAVSMFRLWKASKASWKFEKKVIDWNNPNQRKWSNYARLDDAAGSGSGFSFDASHFDDAYSYVSSRLTFPSKEIAEHVFSFMQVDYKNVMKYPIN